MPQLVWDQIGDRTYETGLDRGVLYLPDGSAVPWNGLTSIIEKFDKEVSPVYYDGMKINNLVVLGSFSGSMRAITYPDEFLELEGLASLRQGIFVGDQVPKVFGLCYRSNIGNDVEGDVAGYKIHVLYNVLAVPSDKTYVTNSDSPSVMEFEWDIVAIPEEYPGIRPTAHLVIDTRDLDPWLLEDIEEKLYGSNNALASLIPMPELLAFIDEWVRIRIVDNGDGTWSAISYRPGLINVYNDDPVTIVDNNNGSSTLSSVGNEGVEILNAATGLVKISNVTIEYVDTEEVLISSEFDGYFQILQANVIYLNDTTYLISDTKDISDNPLIKFIDNGNGTWTAVTEQDSLFSVDVNGLFQISNANAILIGTAMYRVSNTE